VTKGHRSAISSIRRTVDVHVESTGSVSFPDYVALHRRLAGTSVRPPATYDMMQEWLATGHGALVVASSGTRRVGFAYLLLDGEGALYASAAVEPEFADRPVGHAVQDEAIGWLGRHGFTRYELGLQQFPGVPLDHPSTKELGIAKFKRGFGGRLAPLAVMEKYYDDRRWRELWSERMSPAPGDDNS